MKVLLLAISFFHLFAQGQDDDLYAPIKNCLDKYKRGITVLEIAGDHAQYAPEIAQNYDVSMVVIYLGKLMTKVNDHQNLVVLNPPTMTLEMLKTLGRCEHFDVVIVHDIPHRLKKDHELKKCKEQTVEALFKLGDHLFIELPKNEKKIIQRIQRSGGVPLATSGAVLYYCATPKKGIDISRWTHASMPERTLPRYMIKSSYDQKTYSKMLCQRGEIDWLKGINLTTFIMLRGLSPSDNLIKQQIHNLRLIKHNDLCLCNMIVQGQQIVAIDNDDPRRSGNQERLINAALTVFDTDQLRLQDPEAALSRYLTRQ